MNHGPLAVAGRVAERTQCIAQGGEIFDIDTGLSDPLVVDALTGPRQDDVSLKLGDIIGANGIAGGDGDQVVDLHHVVDMVQTRCF